MSGLKMKRQLGIRFQLIAGIVIMTLSGIVLIGALSAVIIERTAFNWKVNEAERLVSFLRASYPSETVDPSIGYRHFVRTLKEFGAAEYAIVGPGGRLLAGEAKKREYDGGDVVYSGESLTIKRLGGGWFRGMGDALHVTARLKQSGKDGYMTFTLPLSGASEDLSRVRRFLLIYALLDAVVIVVFGAYFLSRYIVAPIRALDKAATRIAGGNLDERAEAHVDNEVGSLAASFNTMADRLSSEIKSLERANEELNTAQEELLRSSTLAVVGRLAAGIAHEVGNPLGAVNGYLDILARGGLSKDEERDILERSVREVSRIDFIVREFLEISRPASRPLEPVDMNSVVRETVTTLEAHKDFRGIDTAFVLKEGLPPVLIDARKLRQVFMNILMNAAHSFAGVEGAKKVTIESGTETRTVARRRRRDDPRFSPSPERDFVFVRVTDMGSGVSTEAASRIFEPFYTTKGPSMGTGLGLFVSQSIINTYGGEITLSSSEGAGASFTVSLPVPVEKA
ncbi:MAG: hypothetical protein A2X93_02270 [Deltaproteobacteria bacterium GWC2_56_8]|nr:MAG: hypothetical protein A2X99_03460 [Deltaproteobacteria bacterium GWB2_55_19]OGP32229.1 MAG: hypothetical protein A2X93_02270 [Deltaproteobacteria bacterium GWC2_56_8]HAO92497.1 hypothetical protein [Deltaproteobacteria bacterium]